MTACPDLSQLHDLLQGNLPDAEQASLTGHLDTCPACQRQIEELAGGDSWPGAARRVGGPRSEWEPALCDLVADLKAETAPGEAVSDEDDAFDFLTPPDKPGFLGRFGPYDVAEVVGRGGMGIVFKAFDAVLHRFVAIKVLAPQLAVSSGARKRFAREARAAAAVSHDHVVAIHAVDTAAGLPYLVMQFVPGGSLQERLDRTGPLEVEEVLRIGLQTAAGLSAAHAQGLIHRDVKPANILLENGVERVRLTDFGLARAIDDASLTQTGLLAGTPQYMSPEQASGEPLDHRADLFSLGCVLYEMCTGEPPFRARTALAVLRRVCEDSPQPIRNLRPGTPPWLCDIVTKLLAKAPADRYQSAADVSELLSNRLARLQQPSTPEPAPPHRHRVRTRWAVAAAAMVAAVLGLGLTGNDGLARLAEFAGTVLRIKTPDGTLVIEAGDPNVKVHVNGSEVVVNGAGIAELRVRPGEHQVKALKGGQEVRSELVSVSRGGKQVVKIALEPAAADKAANVGHGHPKPGQMVVDQSCTVCHKVAAPHGKTEPMLACHVQMLVDLRERVPGSVQAKNHAGAVTSVVFSPDGKLLVSAGADGLAVILDAATGRQTAKLKGHTGKIVSASIFPDGKTLVTVGEDGMIKLWDLATGKEQSSVKLPGPISKTSAAAGAHRLALASGDGAVKLWDLASEKKEQVVRGSGDAVLGLAVSPDGRRLAWSDGLARVRLWDATTGQALFAYADGGAEQQVLAFSPDGRLLASGDDQAVRVWEADSAKPARLFLGHGRVVRGLAFSPDGKLIASAGDDQTVRLWDAVTGQELQLHKKAGGKVTCVAYSPDGKRLAWGTEDGTVHILDVRPQTGPAGSHPTLLLQQLRDLQSEVRDKRAAELSLTQVLAEGRKSPDSKLQQQLDQTRQELRVAVERVKALELQIVEAGKLPSHERLRAEAAEQRSQQNLYWSRIAQAHQLWDTARPKEAQALLDASREGKDNWEWAYLSRRFSGHTPTVVTYDSPVRCVAYSPDGQRLASGGEDGSLTLRDAGGNREKVILGAHPKPVLDVRFSPDGRQLATVGEENQVKVWDPARGQVVKTLVGRTCVAFSPDGRTLVTVNPMPDHDSLLVHQPTAGRTRSALALAAGARVHALAYSPDGKLLVVGLGENGGGKVVLVSTENWQPRQHMTMSNPVDAVTFSPNGRYIAAGDEDGTIRVWDVEGREKCTLRGHGKRVTDLSYHPAGQLLASSSADGTVKIWHVPSHEEALTLKGHEGRVNGVAFRPDGHVLATVGADKTLRLWVGTPPGSSQSKPNQ
jgi:eukaryotic-like serine/threonine-protein kinase